MSKIAITAEQFKNKATRLIDIPGFEEGELITVLIKPVSILQMMNNGVIANELLATVLELFGENQGKDLKPEDIFKDGDSVTILTQMMNKVCQEVLVEPKYEEIAEYLTDEQKQSIFEQASGKTIHTLYSRVVKYLML